MITEAQKITTPYPSDTCTVACNEKTDKVHFKIKGKNYHYPAVRFMHAGIRGYHVLMPKKIYKEGLTAEKTTPGGKLHILPLYSRTSFGLFPGESPKQFDICPCHSLGVRLYQCSSGKINNKNLQPAINPVNKKLNDYSNDETGGIDISLTGTTSLNLDLGYAKLTSNAADNPATNMDSNANDGLDISIGIEFGIR